MSKKKDIQTDAVEAVVSDEKIEKSVDTPTEAVKAESVKTETVKTETVVVKKGGSGFAFLALLVAVGVGGAGYYFGQQEVAKINRKFTELEGKIGNLPVATSTAPTSTSPMAVEPDTQQISTLVSRLDETDKKLSALEVTLLDKEKNLNALQTEIAKMGQGAAAQPNDWLLSEADFLLTNALRKLVLDNDVETAISLLKISDEVLTKVSDPAAKTVRAAINNDLKQLLSLNRVDQNALMQNLSQLANSVDELVALNVNFGEQTEQESDKVSDNVSDWKANLEKTATSFMNHFIRITPRTDNASQALLAPNQDIYLRENIRLRLQIAIMAVPRQQNELYKQSLETVAAWVRSYFDTNTEVAVNFLKTVDELAEQSIYIDVPTQLSGLTVLDKILNKPVSEVQKVEISADKGLTEANAVAEKEIKAEEKAADGSDASKAETPNTDAPNSVETNTEQQ
ncbi:uroporphyrinogen-III C-methyltransferase [Actinobacillus porcinus]|uniref:uroporphyrinogen-III C-methyltransferase n=1 Tax=Actinobacillus porcinus TaxID=51048 RepID=UPI0023F4906F|nr:uroporphyrinogen-III C-methyltransferase [Actinobacillus porcinus]MDD7545757.1 uroporphyrinogen-III C-methyltransferase [Actinobacillus porcinus]MDY5848565.1 uroporphyrinogen-III C-methyltransferase [Actinobacillus porcinus]